jgi:hypothetical protein
MKAARNLNKYSRSPGRDLKPRSLEYFPGLVTTRQRRSAMKPNRNVPEVRARHNTDGSAIHCTAELTGGWIANLKSKLSINYRSLQWTWAKFPLMTLQPPALSTKQSSYTDSDGAMARKAFFFGGEIILGKRIIYFSNKFCRLILYGHVIHRH